MWDILARALRIEFDGAWYHVMNRGAGRRPIFRSGAHRTLFLRVLDDTSAIYGIEIHGYCLMMNHYHLLVRTPTAGLGRAMRHLNSVYTQRFNRTVGTDGSLFRGRYKSVLVADDSHLCCVSRYIHLNPVESSIVEAPEEYEASSYRAYLALEITPDWLHTDEILKRFEPGDARRNYRRFVDAGIDQQTRAFYEDSHLKPVLGSEEFREQAEKRICRTVAASDSERPGIRLLVKRPEIEHVATEVCRAFDMAPAMLRSVSLRRDSCGVARGALVLLAREVGGHPLQAIANWLGYRSYASASRAMCRFRAASELKPHLGDLLEAARRNLLKSR